MKRFGVKSLIMLSFCALGAPSVMAQDAQPDSDVVVMSQWTVRIPFSHDPNDPLLIGEVHDPMWAWIEPGVKIMSVNGMGIGHMNAMRAVLRMSTDLQDQTQLPVKLGTSLTSEGELIEEMVVVPVVQDTVLKNGMKFETIFDGSWVTTLIDMPITVDTDLQIGDRLVSYGGEMFDMRTSLRDIFQRERRQGKMNFNVTMLRGNSLLEGSIKLGDGGETNAPKLVASEMDYSKSVVLSQWSVRLPMDDPSNPEVQPDDQIVSVNGIDVGNVNAISAILRLATQLQDQPALDVDLGVRGSTGTTKVRRMSLPIVQDTVMANGIRFESVFVNHTWETTLVHLPDGVDTDLHVGDRVLAYADGQPINARTSLKSVIEGKRRTGMEEFKVIVYRDGEFMKCTMKFGPSMSVKKPTT